MLKWGEENLKKKCFFLKKGLHK